VVIPGEQQLGRVTAALVLGSIVIVLADTIVYQVLIRGQDGPPPDSAAVVPFVSGYMLLMAVLLGLTLLGSPRVAMLRPAMLAAPAAGLMLLGFFALMSIGLPLFVAGILAGIAAVTSLASRGSRNVALSEVAAAVIAVTLLVGGFAVANRIIVCPPTGSMGGGGSGFLTSAYHYTCVNGTLTMYSGDCNGVTGGFDANGNPIPGSNGC
jgi:hypothetical protein